MTIKEYIKPDIEIYTIEAESLLTTSVQIGGGGAFDMEIEDDFTDDDSDAKYHNAFDVWDEEE